MRLLKLVMLACITSVHCHPEHFCDHPVTPIPQINAVRVDEALKGRACNVESYENVISRIQYDPGAMVRLADGQYHQHSGVHSIMRKPFTCIKDLCGRCRKCWRSRSQQPPTDPAALAEGHPTQSVEFSSSSVAIC